MKRALRLSALALLVAAGVWLALTTSPPILEGQARQFFGVWRTRSIVFALALVWLALACGVASVSRRAFTRFALANASLAFAWIAAEIAGLVAIDWSRVGAATELSELGTRPVPHLSESGTTHEDLTRMWGYTGPELPFEYRTDRHGLRNDVDRESADVYLLGDSFLVAALVPFRESVCARLEERLQRPVMNVALIGLSVQAERDLLKELALPLERRLVVQFVFEGNDLLDSASYRRRHEGGSEAASEPRRSLAERTLLNQLVVRLQKATQPHPAYARLRTGRIGEVDYRFGWVKSSWAGREDEITHVLAALNDVRERVLAAGGEYALVLLPSKLRVLGPFCTFPDDSELRDWRAQLSPLPEHVAAWAREHSIACIDVTDALRACAERGEIPWFPGDTHWNAAGHRVVADALAAWAPLAARRNQ